MKCNLLVGISLLLFSCVNPNVIYEEYQSVEATGWLETEPVVFEFELEQAATNKCSILVRHNQDYPKANLWLFVTRTSPAGIVRKDTLDCLLADKYGRWLGRGYGGVYDTEVLLDSLFRVTPGAWTVELIQGMRSQKEKGIVGITDIGIRIEKE